MNRIGGLGLGDFNLRDSNLGDFKLILPSPACAERGFSKALFMTGDRKNQLEMANLKERLVLFGCDI